MNEIEIAGKEYFDLNLLVRVMEEFLPLKGKMILIPC